MTFEQYLNLVDQTYNNLNWRYGQTVMNILYSVWKEKHDELVSSEYDCYYDDSSVSLTLDKLEKEWLI